MPGCIAGGSAGSGSPRGPAHKLQQTYCRWGGEAGPGASVGKGPAFSETIQQMPPSLAGEGLVLCLWPGGAGGQSLACQ